MQAFILLSRLFFHHFEFRLKSRFYRMTEKSNIRLLGPKFFNRRVSFRHTETFSRSTNIELSSKVSQKNETALQKFSGSTLHLTALKW